MKYDADVYRILRPVNLSNPSDIHTLMEEFRSRTGGRVGVRACRQRRENPVFTVGIFLCCHVCVFMLGGDVRVAESGRREMAEVSGA